MKKVNLPGSLYVYIFFLISSAFNWITGKAGEHEDHKGLEAALETEVAASELNNQPNQSAPISRRHSTYMKNQQTKVQPPKGTR